MDSKFPSLSGWCPCATSSFVIHKTLHTTVHQSQLAGRENPHTLTDTHMHTYNHTCTHTHTPSLTHTCTHTHITWYISLCKGSHMCGLHAYFIRCGVHLHPQGSWEDSHGRVATVFTPNEGWHGCPLSWGAANTAEDHALTDWEGVHVCVCVRVCMWGGWCECGKIRRA